MEKIRVLIADDHDLVRAGIRNLLQDFPNLEIAGEAGNGPALLEALSDRSIDCLLIDVTMPDFEPIQAVRQIHQTYPNLKILVVSAYDDEFYVQGLLGAGVDGYHLKDQSLADLRLAIERVLAGEKWLSSSLVNKLIQPAPATPALPPLTTRQQDLLRLLQQGLDNYSIAHRLSLSVKTVENNLTQLYRYINVQSRLEAVNYANLHPEILGKSLGTSDHPAARSPDNRPTAQLTILLVDDNARYRNELSLMLSRVHPRSIIYEAENIDEAVHLAQRVGPRLVFVDMVLGRENGIHCTHRLKSVAPASQVILISAYPDREFHRLGIEAGALAFLDKKDLDTAALRAVIEDILA